MRVKKFQTDKTFIMLVLPGYLRFDNEKIVAVPFFAFAYFLSDFFCTSIDVLGCLGRSQSRVVFCYWLFTLKRSIAKLRTTVIIF